MEYVVYFIIPSIFFIFGAISKRIIRAKPWNWEDWFLGVELVLAALSTGMMHLLDLAFKLHRAHQPDENMEVLSVALFIFATIVLYLFVVIIHQTWVPVPSTANRFARKAKREQWKIVWLAGICNAIGYALFAMFVFLVKGLKA